MKRKILIAIAIIVSVLLLNQIMYAILVPDRPYGRDWEPMFHIANSRWVSEDGRVTILVDDKWMMRCFAEIDDNTVEFDVGYFGESYKILEHDDVEGVSVGERLESWCVLRANADRTIVEVYHVEDRDVHIFEDRSVITFYRVDNTPQPE